MNINSKEYWDERFDTNWLDYAGDKQTLFFAELLCGMLPQSLVNEIREKEYSVCDMGCALGEAVPVFCRLRTYCRKHAKCDFGLIQQ